MSCSRSNKPSDDAEHNGSIAVNTCQECIDFLIDYLDGTLPAAKRTEFELHLELCPPCHRYLQQYQATIRLGQRAMEEQAAKNPPPEALIKAIMAAMKAGHPAKDPGEPDAPGGCGCDCTS
ncbi:MAG: zf-HC2 domain-containing protein [Phycisphaeraceae bacterium]|nr:MAG: zf-HC2 domain-containing protein [Phycisphaeraceae bacterium]